MDVVISQYLAATVCLIACDHQLKYDSPPLAGNVEKNKVFLWQLHNHQQVLFDTIGLKV